jgi:hypothetical protein
MSDPLDNELAAANRTVYRRLEMLSETVQRAKNDTPGPPRINEIAEHVTELFAEHLRETKAIQALVERYRRLQ